MPYCDNHSWSRFDAAYGVELNSRALAEIDDNVADALAAAEALRALIVEFQTRAARLRFPMSFPVPGMDAADLAGYLADLMPADVATLRAMYDAEATTAMREAA